MKNTLDLYNDIQILSLIKEDNELALQILFDRHYDSLFELSIHFLKNTSLAEEVVADVFLKVWQKRKTLHIKKEVKPYLLTATKNLSLNTLTKEKYSFHTSPVKDVAGSEDPESKMQYEQMFFQIDQLISQMPSKRQLVFRLNRFDGMRYKDIAELLEISVETVQKHMVQAVKFMAQHKAHIKGLTHYLTLLLYLSNLFF